MNLLVWGFDGPLAPVVQAWKARLGNDSVYWISDDPQSNMNVFDLFGARGLGGDLDLDLTELKELAPDFLVYADMLSRHDPFYMSEIQDYLARFNASVAWARTVLEGRKIDCVVFANLPHEGPDHILYKMAKRREIKTVLCFQSIFPNLFFVCRDLKDFGVFDTSLKIQASQPSIKVENAYEKHLFYMGKAKWKGYSIFRAIIDGLRLKGNTPYKYYRSRSYRQHVQSSLHEPDLDQQYVYFPLHLQPELTTATLGGVYRDQVIALQKLCDLIPENWSVYVKENPKQTEHRRSSLFFEFLNRNPKIQFIHPTVNTYKLMRKSQFVSTVTGTAGWEAITGGKVALVFGKPWYSSLPGVVRYREGMSIEHIKKYSFAHSELESGTNELLAKAAPGVVDFLYLELLHEDERVSNVETVVNSLGYYL